MAMTQTLSLSVEQEGDTPIDAVVRAATGLIGESRPCVRKGWSLLPYTVGGQRLKYSAVKRSSLFAMQSSRKNDGQDLLTPVAAVTIERLH